jgi:hypothetical protein
MRYTENFSLYDVRQLSHRMTMIELFNTPRTADCYHSLYRLFPTSLRTGGLLQSAFSCPLDTSEHQTPFVSRIHLVEKFSLMIVILHVAA